MSQQSHAAPSPYAGPNRQPVRSGDVAASTVVLIVAAAIASLGCLVCLMTLMFSEGCTDSCDRGELVRNSLLMLVGSVGVGVAGLVVTVLRLRSRTLAWPVAVLTLLLVTAIFTVGFTIQFTP